MVPRELMKATVEWVHSGRQPDSSHPTDLVFLTCDGGPLARGTLGRYFAAAAKRAGETASFHCLRHSYATRVLSQFNELGYPVLGELFLQEQLRHATRETTARYVHATQMEAHADIMHMAVNRAYA